MTSTEAAASEPEILDTAEETIGYADAMRELESILNRLESDLLDIDELGDLVARGAELMSMCRTRLDAAQARVTEIIADLDDSTQD